MNADPIGFDDDPADYDYAPDPDDQPARVCRPCGYGAHHECRDRRCRCCTEQDDKEN